MGALHGPAKSRCRRQAVGPLAAAASAALILAWRGWGSPTPSTSLPPPPDKRHVLRYQEESGRGVNFEVVHGQEAAWEIPVSEPVGVMLFAHGCYHSAGDLWASQPGCPRCLGLPEEIKWRRALLARGMAVIAVSSQDRVGRGCWFEVKHDRGKSMARVSRTVIKRAGLGGLPVYVMGVSGGGMLSLTLPRAMEEVQGVYAQVRAVPPDVLKLPGGRAYPPTVFVHMPARDPGTAALIAADMRALRKAGTPVGEVHVGAQLVTVEFLTARSEGHIDVPMARRIVAVLSSGGSPWLSPNGTLLRAPRPTTRKWAPRVQPVVGQMSLKLDKSLLGELLNVAWARHEMTHDCVDAVVTWLQGGGRGGQARLDELVGEERGKDAAAAAAWREQLRREDSSKPE